MADATRDVGIAESDMDRVPGKSKFQFSAEASRLALDEAGLTVKDVYGLFTTIITEGGQFSSMMMAEYMGITPRFTDSTSLGGSSFVVYVEHAAMAIAAGFRELNSETRHFTEPAVAGLEVGAIPFLRCGQTLRFVSGDAYCAASEFVAG